MLMPKSSDLLHTGLCEASRLRVIHADVTDSARQLAQGHLAGPAASLVLAETLAGVAVLSAELHRPQETLSMRLSVSGPVEGVLVEAAADGALRGYTHVKVLNDIDGRDDIDTLDAMGDRADVQIFRSVPGRILDHASLTVRPASVQAAVEAYFRQSRQRRSLMLLSALCYEGYIDMARAWVIEAMPDSDAAELDRLQQRFDDGSAMEALESAPTVAAFADELGINDLRIDPPRMLRFACRCSLARAEATLAALPAAELQEMVRQQKPAEIHCHMCGRGFTVPLRRLRELLADRSAPPEA